MNKKILLFSLITLLFPLQEVFAIKWSWRGIKPKTKSSVVTKVLNQKIRLSTTQVPQNQVPHAAAVAAPQTIPGAPKLETSYTTAYHSTNKMSHRYHLNEMFRSDPTTIEERYLFNIPQHMLDYNLKITPTQYTKLKSAYHYLLEEYQFNIKTGGSMRMEDWKKVVSLIANIAFFGNKEDAPLILDIIKEIPFEYLEVTDYIAIRVFLLLEAYPQIEQLAEVRAEAHSWTDASNLDLHFPHMRIFDQLKLYAESNNIHLVLPPEITPAKLNFPIKYTRGASLLELHPTISIFLRSPTDDLTSLYNIRNYYNVEAEP